MNLEEWRALRAQGEPATLPSGLEVRLRRVGTLDLAQQGRIPQELRPQLEASMQQGQARAVSLENFQEFAGVIDLVCAACLVTPEGLDVGELPYDDRLAIFMWANEVSGKLKTFRPENGQPVESAFAVGDVRPASKRVAGAGR